METNIFGSDITNLDETQRAKILNLDAIMGAMALIGGIIGAIYAHRTGGKWYRYIGYWILGSVILGLIGRIATTPSRNKTLNKQIIF